VPKIDIAALPLDTVVNYPEPFRRALDGRSRRRLGNGVGLTQFGVNLTTLKPGTWSSQRHWHRDEDEFVYVLAGELVLCEDVGETVLKAGDAAGWKANSGDGHCLINRTDRDAVYLEIGTRLSRERVVYSDIDMVLERDEGGARYLHKSGEPYPPRGG
jgi:uncharacterized cupin superfamily protein